MRKAVTIMLCVLFCLSAYAQADRREVRAGNRKYKKADYKTAELEYRKALAKDSLSLAGWNNLGSVLHQEGDTKEAVKAFSKAGTLSDSPDNVIRSWFNRGCSALKEENYKEAVDAFRKVLLFDPANMDAKERYSYAKKMLEQQQNQEQNQQDQNQDQQDQQNQQNQDQNQNQQDQPDQNQDRNQDQQPPQQQQQDQKISPQQAQQMLKAIQAKEKETQDKVNKEKAALLKSRQKDKNW